jgi:hypothetical protein
MQEYLISILTRVSDSSSRGGLLEAKAHGCAKGLIFPSYIGQPWIQYVACIGFMRVGFWLNMNLDDGLSKVAKHIWNVSREPTFRQIDTITRIL